MVIPLKHLMRMFLPRDGPPGGGDGVVRGGLLDELLGARVGRQLLHPAHDLLAGPEHNRKII